MKDNFWVENTEPKIETIKTQIIENDQIYQMLDEKDIYINEKTLGKKNMKLWNLGLPSSKKIIKT